MLWVMISTLERGSRVTKWSGRSTFPIQPTSMISFPIFSKIIKELYFFSYVVGIFRRFGFVHSYHRDKKMGWRVQSLTRNPNQKKLEGVVGSRQAQGWGPGWRNGLGALIHDVRIGEGGRIQKFLRSASGDGRTIERVFGWEIIAGEGCVSLYWLWII